METQLFLYIATWRVAQTNRWSSLRIADAGMPSMPSHAYHKGTREGLCYAIYLSYTHVVSDSYFVLERIIARGVIREPQEPEWNFLQT